MSCFLKACQQYGNPLGSPSAKRFSSEKITFLKVSCYAICSVIKFILPTLCRAFKTRVLFSRIRPICGDLCTALTNAEVPAVSLSRAVAAEFDAILTMFLLSGLVEAITIRPLCCKISELRCFTSWNFMIMSNLLSVYCTSSSNFLRVSTALHFIFYHSFRTILKSMSFVLLKLDIFCACYSNASIMEEIVICIRNKYNLFVNKCTIFF